MLDDLKKGICMIVDNAFDTLATSSQHNQVSFFGVGNNILHLVFFVLEPSSISGAASQILHKKVRSHHLGCEIATDNFRPSLFDEQNPDLIADRLAKERLLGN